MAHEIERDWVTEAGLRAVCLWVRNSHRCGYVEVPKGHPLHGIDYHEPTRAIGGDLNVPLGKKSVILAFTASLDALEGEEIRRSPDVVFDVHGGITFAAAGSDGYPVKSDGWWFGFDCAHCDDQTAWNPGILRSEDYVVEECESLARQIAERCPWEMTK